MTTEKQISISSTIKTEKIIDLKNLLDELERSEKNDINKNQSICFLKALINKYSAITDPIWWLKHKDVKVGNLEFIEFEKMQKQLNK